MEDVSLSSSFNSESSDDSLGSRGEELAQLGVPPFDALERELAGLSVEELKERIDTLEEENAWLEEENDVLQRFCIQHNVRDRTEVDEGAEALDVVERLRQGTQRQVQLRTLSGVHKHDVAMQVQVMLSTERTQEWKLKEKLLAEKRALLEESELCVKDIEKQRIQFERDVITHGRNPIPGRENVVMSEKVEKFFDDTLRFQDNLVKKLLLKNSTVRSQIAKLKTQLRTKKEMSEVLGQVDYGQLTIENRQFLSKIEERNQELMRLKETAGNTVSVLNKHKNELNQVMSASAQLASDIRARENALVKAREETDHIREEIQSIAATNDKLRAQQQEYIVPSVLDYVKNSELEHDLSKRVKSWERKVEIAEMAMRRQKRLLRTTTGPSPSSLATTSTTARRRTRRFVS